MNEYGKNKTRRARANGGVAKSSSGKRAHVQDWARKSAEQPDVDLIRNVAEAEVTAVEAHPKQPGMYRVAIRLYGENQTGQAEEFDDDAKRQASPTPGEWKDEVDALITGAVQAVSKTGRDETVVTVHEDTLVGMRLLRGRRLTGDEWEGLRQEENREDAYRAALSILERKARTSRELSDALKRKGYAPEVITGCLERLQSRRILDDSSYAKRFMEQRLTGHRKGRRLIRQELLQRGIAKEDADRAISELDGSVEQEAALALARKKWPQMKGELRERKMKLAAFLLRRGYPNGVVRQALDQAITEASHAEEEQERADGTEYSIDDLDDLYMTETDISEDHD